MVQMLHEVLPGSPWMVTLKGHGGDDLEPGQRDQAESRVLVSCCRLGSGVV